MSQQYPQDPNQPQDPQYPAGGPQPQFQQPITPPPGYVVVQKKTHKFRNFVVFPVLGLIALIGFISAATGGGDGGTNASTDTSQGAPLTRNDPRAVTPGKAFTIGKHTMGTGWKVDYEQYTGSKVVGTVTNTSKSTSTAFFSIKFLKDKTVLANFQCNTEELEPGQAQAVECLNMVGTTSRVIGWTSVTAEATF